MGATKENPRCRDTLRIFGMAVRCTRHDPHVTHRAFYRDREPRATSERTVAVVQVEISWRPVA